jgi:hypothetical protein
MEPEGSLPHSQELVTVPILIQINSMPLFHVLKINFNIVTYLLTPWSTVLLEKLTGSQLVKKFPAFYGTRRFITAFTRARHCHYPESDQFNASIPRLEDPF